MGYFSSRRILAKIAAKMTAGAVLAALIAVNCPVTVNGTVISKPEIERHKYDLNWDRVTEKYITPLDDGGYMIFRYDGSNAEDLSAPYLVEYYDSSFRCSSIKNIKAELPIFGGFYADDSGYYVLTGQENPQMSAAVECFRLTKYDKNWKRIGSCGLKDCNTVEPFDASGCNMTTEGNLMVIRTGHGMYGGHQANITILIDISEMKILDSQYAVSIESTGYCSHSFSEYVKIEDHHIIGVDHGDCYPRGIYLWHYGADITSGRFTNKSPTYYLMLPVIGEYEKFGNYTGATLGGLEISSSSYIVAGSSIDKSKFPVSEDFEYDDYGKKNIFVSIFDKSSKEVKTKWITTDAGSNKDYTNPYLVKINDNSYVLIWSLTEKEDTVYYAFIDGKGNIQGSVKSAKGIQADCQPVVSGNEIIWYVRDEILWIGDDLEEISDSHFYSINISDKSFSSKVAYDLAVNQPKNGKAALPYLKAPAGEEVTINLTPDEGYELSYILVNGKRITGNKFTMPAEETSVTVNFKREGSPNLGDTVTIDEISYQVTNSDTEGAGTVALTGVSDQVTSLVIPSVIDINGFKYKVTKVAARALFGNTTVKTVYIGANIVVIDINAFFGCTSLVKVSGGANLKVINQTAFARCPKLSSFTITSKVLNKIGPQAFYLDSKLKTISIKKTTKLTKSGVKKSLKGSKVKTVKVKKSKIWKYRSYFKKSNSGRKVKVKK